MVFLINNEVKKIIEEQGSEAFTLYHNTTAIISGGAVLEYFSLTYPQYSMMNDLKTNWICYNSLHYNDFLKAYEAWITKYKPLENYNKIEATGRTTTEGKTDVKHTTDANHNTQKNAPATTETYYENTDETTERQTSKAVAGGTSTFTDDIHYTNSTEKHVVTVGSGEDALTGSTVDKTTSNVSGNIGVTTSQQMLQSEVDLRLNPLLMMYLDNFIKMYSFCVI